MLKGFFFLTSCCILASAWKTTSFGTGSSASRHEIFRYSTFQLYSIHLYSHLFVEVNLGKKWSGKLTVMFFFFVLGPLWQWSGRGSQNKRKGKGKKTFYKAIARGDETICVSDTASLFI